MPQNDQRNKKIVLKGMFNTMHNVPENSATRQRFFDFLESETCEDVVLDIFRDLLEIGNDRANRLHDIWKKEVKRATAPLGYGVVHLQETPTAPDAHMKKLPFAYKEESADASEISADPVSGDR